MFLTRTSSDVVASKRMIRNCIIKSIPIYANI
jgi:hypothetical protein